MRKKPNSSAAINVAATEAAAGPVPRPESEALQLMWEFYKQHKQDLRSDIKDYREHILSHLRGGAPVEEVFAPFRRAR